MQGTKDLGLEYSRQANRVDKANLLWGYVDSDWAGCPDSRESTSGYGLMLNGAAVSWKSNLRKVLKNSGFSQDTPTLVYEDNHNCITWSKGSKG